MSDEIAQRIANELGFPGLTEILADKLSGADLHSLLLAVLKRRVSKIGAPSLLNPSPVTKPCDLDGRLFNKLERLAYDTASAFDVIELSPVTPLGAVSALAGLDQANTLSTVRAFECASDPTIGLALECARRRKNAVERKSTTRLCTSQRVVRFPMPTNPAFTSHFKLFCLATSGRDSGSFGFETSALREHIGLYLSLLSSLPAADFTFEDVTVELSDTRVVAWLCERFNVSREEIRMSVRARDAESSDKLLEQHPETWQKTAIKPSEELAQYNLPEHLVVQLRLLESEVCNRLKSEHPHARFEFNLHRLTGLGYYDGPCFHIKLKNRNGQAFTIGDGGFVRWTQQLLCDSKERLLTSGIGMEQMCRVLS